MDELIRILHEGRHSLVVREGGGGVVTCDGRGVSDLYRLLQTDPECLAGAQVADKAVGKAAACLVIIGGVKQVYTDVVSTPALALLSKNGITVGYGLEVHHIMNRAGTDWCPMERACYELESTEEIYSVIKKKMSNFIWK